MIADRTWIENYLDTQPLGDYRKDDKAILLLPLSHVFGLSLVLTGLVLSYEVFITEGKYKEENFSFLETEQITRMNGVTSLYRWLAEGNVDTSSLRCGLIGGAPLGEKSFLELEGMTKADALRHPNWTMGPKITVDSATLMNKGLEALMKVVAYLFFDF